MLQDYGILGNLKRGNQVLADRGFDVAGEVALEGATLVTPSFNSGIQQSPLETDLSKKVSNVDIHVERRMGCHRMRFDILHGSIVMSCFKNDADSACF